MTIPVTIVAGYLGAGKTTLVNEMLRVPDVEGVAVMVNDFGSVAIDAELLRQSADGRIQSFANGCVCCSFGDDFAAGLDLLRNQPEAVRHVVVEASGVATPANLRRRCGLPGFRPRGCLVVVDAETYLRKRDDKYVGSLVRRQVVEADWLYVNRDPNSLELGSTAPRLTAEQALEWRALRADDSPTRSSEDETTFASITARQHAPIARTELNRLLAGVPEWVERVKGFVESGGETLLVQRTGNRFEVTPTAVRGDPSLVFIAPAAKAEDMSDLLLSHWSRWRIDQDRHLPQ